MELGKAGKRVWAVQSDDQPTVEVYRRPILSASVTNDPGHRPGAETHPGTAAGVILYGIPGVPGVGRGGGEGLYRG